MDETLKTLIFPAPIGGHISLDFANTTELGDDEQLIESLRSYHHLLAWCWRNELITETQMQHLYTSAESRPDEANTAWQYALETRETIYGIFSTLAKQEEMRKLDLSSLNEILAHLLPYRRLVLRGDVCVWGWKEDEQHLELILLPIVTAAAELLISEQVKHVRQCPNCGWLFVDTSRNHSRRWCSMDFCGSKMKSRRQYERKRSS